MVRSEGDSAILRGLWGWRGSVQREGQAHSPTKSESDSGVLRGLWGWRAGGMAVDLY